MPSVNLSPAVIVNEKDVSTTIPSLATSITGVVGEYEWGPVNYRRLITTPQELEVKFGKPSDTTYEDWYQAFNVLQYNNLLYVVRAANTTTAKNSGLGVSDSTTATIYTTSASVSYQRLNDDVELTSASVGVVGSEVMRFLAKYPGAYGDKLSIAVCSAASLTSVTVSNGIGGGTSFSNIVGLSPDIMSSLGYFAVAEFLDNDDGYAVLQNTYIVSSSSSEKDSDGNLIYFEDYITTRSNYVVAVAMTTGTFTPYSVGDTNLSGGTYGTIGETEIKAAYDLFADPEEFDVNILVDCHNQNVQSAATVASIQQYIAETIIAGRLDCVGINNVPKSTVVNASDPVGSMTTYALSSLSVDAAYQSYVSAPYGNWKYQFDKYSGKYRWLPVSGDLAGIYARTDNIAETWMAAAGFNRGGVKNVQKFAFKPNKAQRDIMYKSKVNPVLTFIGDGSIVLGQKTFQTKPSAFDRMSIRRLFIYMEKAISTASKYFLFEKNTEFTQRLLKGIIDPFLADIKAREGIIDFLVVTDSTVNTPEVIDRNEMACVIYIKAARDIETLALTFVNTKSGVTFTELLNQ